MKKVFSILFVPLLFAGVSSQEKWQSKFVRLDEKQQLVYISDEKGNVIPDFSAVGFASGEKEIPDIQPAEILEPLTGDNREQIQDAIDRIAKLNPDKNGYRGALLLKKGVYNVNGTIFIRSSGIVIKGEGSAGNGTMVREVATKQCDLFKFSGKGSSRPQESTKTRINEDFVPVGRKFIQLSDVKSFQVGDSVLIYRPATDNWIHDLKMDRIVEREGTLDILKLMVEVQEQFFSDEIKELEALRKKIRNNIQSTLGISVDVKLVEPKTIERTAGKAKRVIDNRKI